MIMESVNVVVDDLKEAVRMTPMIKFLVMEELKIKKMRNNLSKTVLQHRLRQVHRKQRQKLLILQIQSPDNHLLESRRIIQLKGLLEVLMMGYTPKKNLS